LIKQCQAQVIFNPAESNPDTLQKLLRQEPDVYLWGTNIGPSTSLALDAFMGYFSGVDITDPLQSAMALDIIRGAEVTDTDRDVYITRGWNTEIYLAETPQQVDANFEAIFDINSTRPLFGIYLPAPWIRLLVYKKLCRFRERLEGSLFTARATHKNMSRSTRREVEEFIGHDLDQPIFGQDDWQKLYHYHDFKAEGVVEMRQKWYRSQAKPRTYFAMGGSTYDASRFLQDFFLQLTDLVPCTNHKTRLRPNRLYVQDPSTDHLLIYDMSSFTSNMRNQKQFNRELAEFMRGVTVYILDERYGPTSTDLGDLLDQYNDICVDGPYLSYERAPQKCWSGPNTVTRHGSASMLGIFGNLTSCTFAHFLLMTPVIDGPDQDNTAGDDGALVETPLNQPVIPQCLEKVGVCAPDKCYRSDEYGVVCLKRPLHESPPGFDFYDNIVPPNINMTLSYLGIEDDPRYDSHYDDNISLIDRINLVGKDMRRFMMSAYKQKYQDLDKLCEVYEFFTGLVAVSDNHQLCKKLRGPRNLPRNEYILWPVHPRDYDFLSIDPIWMMCSQFTSGIFPKRDTQPCKSSELRLRGDKHVCNSDKRLKLLFTLGYLERDKVVEYMMGPEGVARWYAELFVRIKPEPTLYTYTVLEDIPDELVFDPW
jgi:hypothetical protein